MLLVFGPPRRAQVATLKQACHQPPRLVESLPKPTNSSSRPPPRTLASGQAREAWSDFVGPHPWGFNPLDDLNPQVVHLGLPPSRQPPRPSAGSVWACQALPFRMASTLALIRVVATVWRCPRFGAWGDQRLSAPWGDAMAVEPPNDGRLLEAEVTPPASSFASSAALTTRPLSSKPSI